MRFTVKFGSRLRMIAVFTSTISMRTGVEIAGKPKPSAPCATPAKSIVTAAAVHTAALRAISDSMMPSSKRVRSVSPHETHQRPLDAAADSDHLEQLAHLGRR